MTPEKTKQLLPIIQAYADGKTIQFKSIGGQTTGMWVDDKLFNPFDNDEVEYRIKPEPKLRPWNYELAPVGALIRHKVSAAKALILRADEGGIYIACGTPDNESYRQKYERVLNEWEHSTDQGKSWMPCGVAE